MILSGISSGRINMNSKLFGLSSYDLKLSSLNDIVINQRGFKRGASRTASTLKIGIDS
jgi:hypothetical protein